MAGDVERRSSLASTLTAVLCVLLLPQNAAGTEWDLTGTAGVQERSNVLITADGATLAPPTTITTDLIGCTADATYVADYRSGSLAPLCSKTTSAATLTGNYVWTSDGLRLKNASGTGQLCIPSSKTWWRLGEDWWVRLIVQPNEWKTTSATLASVPSGWSVYTPSGTLMFLVSRSPDGRGAYNKQWMLGVQERLVGAPHVFDIENRMLNGQRVTTVRLDGEVRADLRQEWLNQNPNGGKLCMGGAWDLTVHGIEIHNGTAGLNQSAYAAPTPYTIYPGTLRLASIPVDPAQPLRVTASVSQPSVGTRVYLDPRFLAANGTLLPRPGAPIVSLIIMACGVSSKKNHTWADVALPALRAANATVTCVISDAGRNLSVTDAMAAAGDDVGLEYNINDCAGLGRARQSWLVDRGIAPHSFVNYFGINTEAGLGCVAQHGLNFLSGPSTDNPAYFRPTLHQANCGYKTDVLACLVAQLDHAVATGVWTMVSSHWTEKAYNDSLWPDFVAAAQARGVRLESVAEVQRTHYPVLDSEAVTLNVPADAVAVQPTLLFFSDGTQAPVLRSLSMTAGSQPLASCSDGVQNQDETGPDCGGICGGYWYDNACHADPPPLPSREWTTTLSAAAVQACLGEALPLTVQDARPTADGGLWLSLRQP